MELEEDEKHGESWASGSAQAQRRLSTGPSEGGAFYPGRRWVLPASLGDLQAPRTLGPAVSSALGDSPS